MQEFFQHNGKLSLNDTGVLATIEQFRLGAIPTGLYAEALKDGPFTAKLLDGQIGVDIDNTYFIHGDDGETFTLASDYEGCHVV